LPGAATIGGLPAYGFSRELKRAGQPGDERAVFVLHLSCRPGATTFPDGSVMNEFHRETIVRDNQRYQYFVFRVVIPLSYDV
jgi:hypothetical protein